MVLLGSCFVLLLLTELVGLLLRLTYSWHFIVRVSSTELLIIFIPIAALSLFKSFVRAPVFLILAFFRHWLHLIISVRHLLITV